MIDDISVSCCEYSSQKALHAEECPWDSWNDATFVSLLEKVLYNWLDSSSYESHNKGIDWSSNKERSWACNDASCDGCMN